MPNLLRQMMMQARLMSPEGDGGGGGGPPVTPPVTPPITPPVKSGNPLLDLPIEEVPDAWREHARELRRENASLREKTKAIDEAAAQAKIDEAVKKAVDAQEAKTKAILEDERKASHRRIINSEVKGMALSLGIQDADAIKLIDTSSLVVDENGEVAGVTELIAAFKTAKPYLFKEPPASSSHIGEPPPKKRPEAFDARKETLTPEELKAKARELGFSIKT